MKLLAKILSTAGFTLTYPAIVLAHETEEAHAEPATIDPVVAIIVVVIIAILGFLLWKFILNKKESPPQKPN
ncbi:MAG: hypothetical protein A3H50_00345 [Candidatus Levybacteria bacterium RIFCSPLOWO2_02_FULL_37_10]|nr:MAG: hypothetical protein A2860_03735 [Candidatus Levybacteria bacterium RIFCSPHIGHO2_01_FULL_37_33]OGH17549.1 MAG: hypothetical protein A3C97_01925 [Candidatus Levybacteria bacterium RIFCSPHIGHO2_02_FULL_37_11]OGH30061.1 MAG: hypothetical protein A3F30_03615 [Candidatus Levybacteria bacterium RIFCSPHIGHO2_12_FULL_37_12]OGH32355.1 MAG: hypothetical protein A2953_01775 [Candidatus Levybacteria bacterium RIFCSPLOWO2_01_FULL_36_54]OGH46323.1 MAG: hypothetical protein A3H50_00345 [Candidatus Lev